MAEKSCGLHFGWVVLAATFYLNLVVDGYCFIFGILLLQIEDDYPTYPTWTLSIIGGLVPTIYLILAPICIAINEFLGPCRVIIFASILSASAFLLAWANAFLQAGFVFDLFMLGIFQGIASALLYGPSIAVIPDYFPPHQRSLATGITTCGSPVGAIFYGVIIHPLFAAYGWRGTLVIVAGLNLNGVICALAFKESLKPKPKKLRTRRPVSGQQQNGKSFEANCAKVEEVLEEESDDDDDKANHRPPDDRESVPIPHCHIIQKISEDKLRSRLDTNHSLDNAIITRDNMLIRVGQLRQNQLVAPSKGSVQFPIDEEDQSAASSASDVVMSRTQQPSKLAAEKAPPPYSQRPPPVARQTSKTPSQIFQSVVWIASSVIREPKKTFTTVLRKYFNAKLVCRPSFICLLFAAIFSIVGYYVPMLLVTSQAQNPDWNVSLIVQRYLVLMWGVFNAIGRFVTGRLGDLGKRYAIFTSYWIFIIGHCISAAALLIFPHTMILGDAAFITFIVVYGFFIAPLVTMRSVIVSDLYGAENAGASFGWFLCVQGFVQILGFILPTWLDSLAPLYAYAFGAACFLLSSGFVAMTFKPYFKARRETIEKEEQEARRQLEIAAFKEKRTLEQRTLTNS